VAQPVIDDSMTASSPHDSKRVAERIAKRFMASPSSSVLKV
jgi:hypothetical protein